MKNNLFSDSLARLMIFLLIPTFLLDLPRKKKESCFLIAIFLYIFFLFYSTGQIFKAHKLILAACSKNFADLFESHLAPGPVCVILEATSAENMAALLEFMYKGEVHVSQKALESFLKAAESLQVILNLF